MNSPGLKPIFAESERVVLAPETSQGLTLGSSSPI